MKKKLLLGLFLSLSVLFAKAADSTEKSQLVVKTAAEVMQARMGYVLETPTPLLPTKAFRADGVSKPRLDSILVRDDISIFSKEVFGFDAKGNHIKHELYNQIANGYGLAFLRELKYDANNYETERIDKDLDPSTGVCLLGSKRNWVVNSEGYIIQENKANFNDITLEWDNYSEFHYTYDQNGNVIEMIGKGWNSATNQYVNNSKIEQTFDENQNLAAKALYSWIGNEWVGQNPKYVYNYAYDIGRSDLQTLQAELLWNTSTKSWEDYARQRFVYNENGLVVDYFAEFITTGNWKPVQYSNSIYMDDIYLTSTIVYIDNGAGGFDVGVKDIFTFNGIDDETGAHKFVGTREQLLEGSMEKTFDYEFHFIGLLQTVMKEIYTGGDSGVEQPQGLEYTFDERGNPTGMIVLEYNTTSKQWRNYSKVEQKLYNYDANKTTESINYRWNGTLGSWMPESKTEQEYCDAGYLIYRQTGGYNESGEWIVSSGERTTVDYNVPISEVLMPNTLREGSTWAFGYKFLRKDYLAWEEEGAYSTQWMNAFYTTVEVMSADKVIQDKSVYANNGTLYVNTVSAETINVYTISGTSVITTPKTEGAQTIDISNLAKGVYIVNGSTGWNVKITK